MYSSNPSRLVRRAVAAASLAVAGLSLTACSSDADGGVVVGFYPLEFLASEIGGDEISVSSLAQPGAEPHDMELTAKQVGSISAASLVIYEKGLQPAVDDAIANEDPHATLDVTTVTDLVEGYDDLGHSHEGESDEEHAEHEDESSLDLHIWLDPELMRKMADAVTDKLVEIDEKNAAAYEANNAQLQERLSGLDEAFETGLATCERTQIVTTHNAFGYLARAYGLEQIGIAGLTGNEPSPQKLAEVEQYVKSNGVTTIFYETAVSDEYAKTVAAGTGAKTAVLDPLETKPASGDYITAMEANLQALRAALGCS